MGSRQRRAESSRCAGAVLGLLCLSSLPARGWGSAGAAAAGPARLRARALCPLVPPAPALSGFGGFTGSGSRRARGTRPQPGLEPGSALGLTRTTPRVSRFEKCSPSLPVSLWVRFPGPDFAAFVPEQGLGPAKPRRDRAVTGLLGKHDGIWVGTKQGSPCSGASAPGVCSLSVFALGFYFGTNSTCSVLVTALELSPSANPVWQGGGCAHPQPFPGLL